MSTFAVTQKQSQIRNAVRNVAASLVITDEVSTSEITAHVSLELTKICDQIPDIFVVAEVLFRCRAPWNPAKLRKGRIDFVYYDKKSGEPLVALELDSHEKSWSLTKLANFHKAYEVPCIWFRFRGESNLSMPDGVERIFVDDVEGYIFGH